jgi:hypothetical protein
MYNTPSQPIEMKVFQGGGGGGGGSQGSINPYDAKGGCGGGAGGTQYLNINSIKSSDNISLTIGAGGLGGIVDASGEIIISNDGGQTTLQINASRYIGDKGYGGQGTYITNNHNPNFPSSNGGGLSGQTNGFGGNGGNGRDNPGYDLGTPPGGGTGVFNYQWESSLNQVVYTSIGGANSSTYLPAGIVGTLYYRRNISSSVCQSQSADVAITNDIPVGSNIIGNSQTLCAGIPAQLTGSLPTGGNSIFSYQWQSWDGVTSWNSITAATAINYQPPFTTATTYYRRIVRFSFIN